MPARQKVVLLAGLRATKYVVAAQDIETAAFEDASGLHPDVIEELLSMSRRLTEIAENISHGSTQAAPGRLN